MGNKKILIVLAIILAGLILGMGSYYFYVKLLNKEEPENEIIKNENDIEEIQGNPGMPLTSSQKDEINALLNEQDFSVALYVANDYGKNFSKIWDINIFENDENRFVFTCNFKHKNLNFIDFGLVNGYVDFNLLNEQAEIIFGQKLNIHDIPIYSHPELDDFVMCYGTSGLGQIPKYKIRSLFYDEQTEIYTMNIDVSNIFDGLELIKESKKAEFKYKSNGKDITFKDSIFISFIIKGIYP